MPPFEIACCLELKNESLVYNYLMPIARHAHVSRLWVIRSRPCGYGDIPKASYLLAPQRPKVLRWVAMLAHCARLARRPQIRAFVSFNPLPYGLIGAWAAWRRKKSVHFGFIGSDWYRDCRGTAGLPVRQVLQRGDFFTTTGDGMRGDMVACGFPPDRIAVLPHCIDLGRYAPCAIDDTPYACIFVGRLIDRKKVDVILRAFASVLKTRPQEKLCIVGDGPRKHMLVRLAAKLGISGSVDFVGEQARVQDFFCRSRINIIASCREGLPFAVIEGICCGVVPVCTPAGTLTDVVKHEQTGLLFPHNNAAALAGCIIRLLNDRAFYAKLRTNILELRSGFAFERATAVWSAWFAAQES